MRATFPHYRSTIDPKVMRTALSNLPLVASQETLQPPDLGSVYVPSLHRKALSLDASIVVGMRGAGKSFWTAVLASAEHRAHVAQISGWKDLLNAQTRVGFGQSKENRDFPDSNKIKQLVVSGIDVGMIWSSVVLRHAFSVLNRELPGDGGILDFVSWVRDNTVDIEKTLNSCDQELVRKKVMLVVLFDALDRLAEAWDEVRELTRAALRFCLGCRTTRAIRLKFFLRPDMEQDDQIWNFADSSKLKQGEVDLQWRASDLYGLVLQYLANNPDAGTHLRDWTQKVLNVEWDRRDEIFIPPADFINDEDKLRPVVEALTGEWMGRDRKRGYAYTWIPTHLADAKREASPRSMLLAMHRAAEWTTENARSHSTALHYQGIQHGVTEASTIRVNEIIEDYPWVRPALEAIKGVSVPCSVKDLEQKWNSLSPELLKSQGGRLPPRRFFTDPYRSKRPKTLMDDLVDLAVLYRTDDGRINMPDIFRVGFGIKRKGGVKPVR